MAGSNYQPLDYHDTNLRRVKTPPPELHDPNDPAQKIDAWDFDLKRAESARFGVRPIAILSIVGAVVVGVTGVQTLASGIMITMGAMPPEAIEAAGMSSGERLITGAVLSLLQTALFVYIAVGCLMKSRIAAMYGFLAVALLIMTQITGIMGIYGGVGLFSVLFTMAYALSVPIAVEATYNLHRMRRLGVDMLPPDADAEPG
ncbi:hypothetical protein [Hyphobacterium sp.]|uniref:hypothetical protein n=1 Tax=Hyphobacterium sp. TaxID=2004662 RepID=UPI003B52F269